MLTSHCPGQFCISSLHQHFYLYLNVSLRNSEVQVGHHQLARARSGQGSWSEFLFKPGPASQIGWL